MRVTGWRCAVCDATVASRRRSRGAAPTRPTPIGTTSSPSSTPTRRSAIARRRRPLTRQPGRSSLITHDHDLAWAAYADANGLDRDARTRARGADRRRGPAGRGDRIRPDPVRPVRRAVGRAGLRRRRWRVGQGRDRGSGRQPEGAPPGHDPAPPPGGRADRAPHRTTPAGDRLVRQRRPRRVDARRRRRLADRRVRPHLDDRRLRLGTRPPRRHGPPLRTPSARPARRSGDVPLS